MEREDVGRLALVDKRVDSTGGPGVGVAVGCVHRAPPLLRQHRVEHPVAVVAAAKPRRPPLASVVGPWPPLRITRHPLGTPLGTTLSPQRLMFTKIFDDSRCEGWFGARQPSTRRVGPG